MFNGVRKIFLFFHCLGMIYMYGNIIYVCVCMYCHIMKKWFIKYVYKKMYICHTQYFEKIIYNHKYRFMSSEIKFVHQLRISNVGISRLSPPVANFIILINNMITCVYIDMCIAKMCTLCSYYFPQAYRSSNIETQDFNLYFLHVMLFVIENYKMNICMHVYAVLIFL